MAKFGENYKGGRNAVFCPLSPGEHLDTQKESFTCPVIRDKITIQETYDTIFISDSPSLPILGRVINDIEKIWENYSQ